MTSLPSASAWPVRDNALASEPVSRHENHDAVIPFVALIVFTCILLLNPQAWFPVLKPLRIAFISAGLAAAALLWEQFRGAKPLGLTREIVICFLLVGWGCMTVPISYWPGGSVATLTNEYIKAVIVFWLLANVVSTKRRLYVLCSILMLCSIPLARMAVKNYVAGNFLPDSDVVARITGYGQGLSANSNDLALMLNLLLPLSIARLLSATRTFVKILCAAAIVITAIAVIVTFSRAGFLGLITIVGLYLMRLLARRGGDRRWALAMLFAALMALPLVPQTYVDRISTVTNVEADRTGSSHERWRDIRAAARFVTEHPIIGAGLGMDIFALNQIRGAKWVQVHNVYLQYAVDLGVPGGTLFLLLLYGVWKGVRTSRKALASVPAERDLFLLTEALETSLIVFAICGFFHPVAYQFYFYYFGGLALAAQLVTRNVLSANPQPAR